MTPNACAPERNSVNLTPKNIVKKMADTSYWSSAHMRIFLTTSWPCVTFVDKLEARALEAKGILSWVVTCFFLDFFAGSDALPERVFH